MKIIFFQQIFAMVLQHLGELEVITHNQKIIQAVGVVEMVLTLVIRTIHINQMMTLIYKVIVVVTIKQVVLR